MAEQIYTYRDPSFNLNQAYDYTLLMQIDASSFSYAVTYKKVLLAWGTNCSLKELAGELSAAYKKVVIGLPAKGFSLIPAAVFDKEHVTGYARLLDVKPDEKVLAQQLDDQNFIIYKVDAKIIPAVEKFGLANTVYLYKGWIRAIGQNDPEENSIYINLNNNKADFLYFKNGHIRFYNSFEYVTTDDLAYFAALVAEELELVPGDTTLVLSGNTPDDAPNRLAEFFKEAVFNSTGALYLPDGIPTHQIMALAALNLCGSLEEL